MTKENLNTKVDLSKDKKKKANENFRTEKYNSQSKELNGWAQ